MNSKLIVIMLCAMLLPLFGMAQRSIAVMPTICRNGSVSDATLLQVYGSLEAGSVNKAGYQSFDRSSIDRIVDEISFQKSGMVNDDEIRQFRFAGVDYILVSEAIRTDDGNLFVTCKIVNVETARISQTISCTMCSRSDIISKACNNIAIRMAKNWSGTLPPFTCGYDTTPPPPPPGSCTGVVREDLAAYYMFERNANDCMDSRRHGNEVGKGINYTSGVSGSAVQLLGPKEQRVNIPYRLLGDGESWSVCFWIKDFGTGLIFALVDGSRCIIGLSATSRGQLAMVGYSQVFPFEYNARDLQSSRWHHIAIVSDDEHRTTQLYVDGSKVDEMSRTFRPSYGNKIILGGKMDKLQATSFKMDNLRFYPRQLDDSEVQLIYSKRQ